MNLNAPGVPKLVEKHIKEAIDKWCVDEFEDEHREHLGASVIGHECSRYLWYSFRWCFKGKYLDEKGEYNGAEHGRALRLFQRGHLEENRFAEYLSGIGCRVWLHDDNGEQFRTAPAECEGHFGGSLDAVVEFPDSWKIEPGSVLGEFKTASSKNFEKMIDPQKGGMILAKNEHYVQSSVYGSDERYNFSHCLYMVACKDDDRLHIELVKLDHNLGRTMRHKALRVIQSQEPLPKVSSTPTYWRCRYCSANDICWKDALPERNCRSCKHCYPGVAKSWNCNKLGVPNLPPEAIAKGCPQWEAITR